MPAAVAHRPQQRSVETWSLRSRTSLRSNPSTRPPSYGRHFHDELLSPAATNHSSNMGGRAHHRQRQARYDHITQMLMLLTSSDPLTLTIDNASIYPPPPSNALYHLPRPLTWSGNEISVSRSLPVAATRRASASARDLALYNMRRTPFTHEVVLLPRREGLQGAVMRGHKGLFGGMTWDVEVRGERVLRYSKGKWKMFGNKATVAEGGVVVVATEHTNASDWSIDEEAAAGAHAQPREQITIAGEGVEMWMKDLIVAAWCGRIWQANNAKVSLTRSLMRGQVYVPFLPIHSPLASAARARQESTDSPRSLGRFSFKHILASKSETIRQSLSNPGVRRTLVKRQRRLSNTAAQ